MKGFILVILLFTTNSWASYLFVEGSFNPTQRWSEFSKDPEINIKNLFQQLIKSKTGKALLKAAKDKSSEYGSTLYDIVKEGEGSLTDTTLVRRFNMASPEHIVYESKSKIYLNKNLTQYDALLDLAHELTHFVYRKNFNPYVKNFSLSEFIRNTIEGTGGEVQAFVVECIVHSELFPGKMDSKYNCENIYDKESKKFSTKLAIKKFYQVGSYYESFIGVLNKHGIVSEFPEISESKESFISSAYGIPYPVAAFEEYLTVLNKVCENDKRRLGYMKVGEGRSPASVNQFESDYKTRCKDIF